MEEVIDLELQLICKHKEDCEAELEYLTLKHTEYAIHYKIKDRKIELQTLIRIDEEKINLIKKILS